MIAGTKMNSGSMVCAAFAFSGNGPTEAGFFFQRGAVWYLFEFGPGGPGRELAGLFLF